MLLNFIFNRAASQPLEERLESFRQKILKDNDKQTFTLISELYLNTVRGWPVDTLASRLRWDGPVKIADSHYQIRNEIPYVNVLEFGGYPGVGPKTARQGATVLPGGIQVNGGIYPTQKPAAPLRQAFSKAKLRFKEVFKVDE